MVIYILYCATVYTEMCLKINHSFLGHGHTFLPSDRHCGLTETEGGKSDLAKHATVDPLNTELNPICHLLALYEAHHILHVSKVEIMRICKTSVRLYSGRRNVMMGLKYG